MIENSQTENFSSAEIIALLDDLVMELHFRGCKEEHKLIRRTRRMREILHRGKTTSEN